MYFLDRYVPSWLLINCHNIIVCILYVYWHEGCISDLPDVVYLTRTDYILIWQKSNILDPSWLYFGWNIIYLYFRSKCGQEGCINVTSCLFIDRKFVWPVPTDFWQKSCFSDPSRLSVFWQGGCIELTGGVWSIDGKQSIKMSHSGRMFWPSPIFCLCTL